MPPLVPSRLAGPSSGCLLPSLELQFPDGRRAPLWDYRGRGLLVVYWHGAPGCAACRTLLAALAAAHPQYREVGAQVLAIGAAAVADVPYPVLLDPAGRLAARLADAGVLPTAAPPALLVVGRTGELWAAWGGAHAALPSPAQLWDWVESALSECRECFCCEQVWPAE